MMLQSYKNKRVRIIDNGIFCEIAVKLSQWFGQVEYYSPWEEAYVKSNNRLVGDGIPGVKRQNRIFDDIDKVDLWVFPDLYHSDLQDYLEKKGKRVWGSRSGENLELYRAESKEHFKKLGLPVGNYKTIIGMDALRAELKPRRNVFVKVSVTRGDFESFHVKNYSLIEPKLDEMEHNLGEKKKIAEFIVEDGIDGVEIGYDGYCIDGIFPKTALLGLEVKDKSYIGHVQQYANMPRQITDFTRAIGDTMKQAHYRNFMSTENRITPKGTSYMNDLCARQGSPPSELYINMFDNLPDIIWYGAEGKCIDPIISKPWGAECIIDSFWSDRNWQAIQFPPEYRDNVKLRQFTRIKGQYYVIPQNEGSTTVGAVVGVGNTLEEAVKKVKDVAKKIEGYNLIVHDSALDKAQDEINKLKPLGIKL
jgi:hypothetical protein